MSPIERKDSFFKKLFRTTVIHYSLFTIHYSLFTITIHYSLSVSLHVVRSLMQPQQCPGCHALMLLLQNKFCCRNLFASLVVPLLFRESCMHMLRRYMDR